ncbi:MAG: hypothetical protein EOO38_32195 [Cytophagaceae bacterium]|nr:MAG: hypothetical protein EOO38_32195 [Cytophagaceae bacterium]
MVERGPNRSTAMAGNGDRLRETITQLSDVGRILGEGSGDIVDDACGDTSSVGCQRGLVC